jgi:hypothetical protein
MPHYCVHILDSSGKVIGEGRFDCVNTEIAQERVRQLAGDLETELWRSRQPFRPGRELEGVLIPERDGAGKEGRHGCRQEAG